MNAHFTPWNAQQRPCWHCTQFVALVYEGSAARCSLPNGPRIVSMPAGGCSAFEREVGSDDEPDAVPDCPPPLRSAQAARSACSRWG